MVPLSALWLPILLSAVIVFVASSIMHMLLPYHQSDYQKLPDEDKVLATLGGLNLKRGLYIFPFCTHKEMKSPAVLEKFKQGPVGMMTIRPTGMPAMGKFMVQWFVYCLVVGFFVAYLTGHTVASGETLSRSIPRRGHGGIPCLRPRTHQRWNLEGPDVERYAQRSLRWTHLRAADRRNVRLALAAVGSHSKEIPRPRA